MGVIEHHIASHLPNPLLRTKPIRITIGERILPRRPNRLHLRGAAGDARVPQRDEAGYLERQDRQHQRVPRLRAR